MEPIDNKIKSELARSPFKKSGFNETLRRSIEQRLDEAPRRKSWRLPLAGTLCAAVIASLIIWQPASPNPMVLNQKSDLGDTATQVMDQEISLFTSRASDSVPMTVDSALLIGFRLDTRDPVHDSASTAWSYSQYRSLLIAPYEGKISLIAEGDGLLVPYGQQFWLMQAPIRRTTSDAYQTLTSYPAGSGDAPILPEITDDPDTTVQHTQRILYAGNDYVSIEETEKLQSSKTSSHHSHVWVGRLEQFSQFRTLSPPDKPFEDHISLSSVFGTKGDQAVNMTRLLSSQADGYPENKLSGDHWAIVREKTKWVPKIELSVDASVSADQPYKLLPLALELPNTVVSYDELCCEWSEIRKVVPDATDALSSPTEDIMVVLTENRLSVHLVIDGRIGAEPQLRIDLQPNEQLVMAEWATSTYIPSWIDAAERYLIPPSPTN
jgi:hypothetical protein